MESVSTYLLILSLLLNLRIISIRCSSDENKDTAKRSPEKSNLPSKIDLGIILDSVIEEAFFDKSINVLQDLFEHLSISPGTTRVAFYTITSHSQKKIFSFKDHVNRECVLRSMKNMKYEKNSSINNTIFTQTVGDIVDDLKRKSKEVDNLSRVYIFITSSKKHSSIVRNVRMNTDDIMMILQPSNGKESKTTRGKSKSSQTGKNNKASIFEFSLDKGVVMKILKSLRLPLKSYVQCNMQDSSPVVDECERYCTCQNGKMQDCYRVRKEFTAMTKEERRRYLKTYKTLTSTPPYREVYEKFIFMHYKYFCWGIHNRDLFLPWHRWFLSKMEDLLRQIDCRVTIPYWDWSYVSEDPWNRTNLWRSTDDGLGSNGNRYKGYCVQKGIFRESEWTTPYWEDPMDIILSSTDQLRGSIKDQRGHLAFCLRRGFKGHTPSRKSVLRTLKLPPKRFKDFDIQMRHNFHDRVHNIIGGTMCTHYAGNTPEFFFHHSFLDKIWFTWQEKSSKHKWVHFLQRNTTKMMGSDYTQKELTDSHNLPRCMKVRYEPFPSVDRSKRSIDILDDDDSMARRSTNYWKEYLLESWDGVFPNCSRSKQEKRRANYLHKVLDGP